MTQLTDLLNQFLRRYRRALVVKAGVLAALGVGIIGLLAWRLQAMPVGALWALGLPAVLALGAVANLSWWLRHHWISRQAAASQLDKALNLQQRLVTAEEFSSARQPPVLYPLLVQDAARFLSTRPQARLPRPVNRTTAVLIAALLFLLLWPVRGHSPMRLAMTPTQPPAGPPGQQPIPTGTEPSQDSRSASSSSSRPGDQSQASASDAQGEGQQPDAARSQGASEAGQSTASQGQAGDASQRSSAASRQDTGATPSDRGTRPDAGASGSSPQRAHASDAEDQRGRQTADGQPQQGSHDERSAKEAALSGNRTEPTARDTTASPHGANAVDETASDDGETGRPMAHRSGDRQRGGGGDLQSQEALKADIQELLKELSGELQELQAQLASAPDQVPRPGTATDPELYGSRELPEGAAAGQLPIQLRTDVEAARTERPGGGVGAPSGSISEALPQTQAESAELSTESVEVAPVSRQPVPREYRNVFDRLFRRGEAPKEPSAR